MLSPADKSDQIFTWPDAALYRHYAKLLSIYESLVAEQQVRRQQLSDPCLQAFSSLCSAVVRCATLDARLCSSAQLTLHEVLLGVRDSHGSQWLQAVASMLGMLLHLVPGQGESRTLTNNRRPNKKFSTYPTSPLAARIVVQRVMEPLLPKSLVVCQGTRERLLPFALIDPSAESGQLLLEVVIFLLESALKQCENDREKAQISWNRLALELPDCLWGGDRNNLAPIAIKTVFSLLRTEYQLPSEPIRNIYLADSLLWLSSRQQSFDVVLNNPPWGEPLEELQRDQIRGTCDSVTSRVDTYLAFAEFGLRALRRGGRYGLILPAQSLALEYAADFRQLLAQKTRLESIILFPSATFAPATVSSVGYIGQSNNSTRRVTVSVLGGTKGGSKMSLDKGQLLSGETWWRLISARAGADLCGIPLGQIGAVRLGVQLYAIGKGCPPQTKQTIAEKPFTSSRRRRGFSPALRGRDVTPYRLKSPSVFVKFGPWLANPGAPKQRLSAKRVLVRELCRRDGKLTAAVERGECIPLHGVHCIFPTGIRADVLTAILNSSIIARYVRTHAGSFTKVDFQRITIGELRELPIPPAAIVGKLRACLGLSALKSREVQLLREIATRSSAMNVQARTGDKIILDNLINRLYQQGARYQCRPAS
jgi:hypothetical protein